MYHTVINLKIKNLFLGFGHNQITDLPRINFLSAREVPAKGNLCNLFKLASNIYQYFSIKIYGMQTFCFAPEYPATLVCQKNSTTFQADPRMRNTAL